MTGNSSRVGVTFLAARFLVLTAGMLGSAGPVLAEMTPTLNSYGVIGLIDTPTAERTPDGYLSFSSAHFGPVSRTTLSFQVFPKLNGSFRYSGIRNWNDLFCPPDCDGENQYETHFDRSFDLRYQLFGEGQYRPSLTIGLQDFIGTGLQSAEYLVATKTLSDRLKVTAGLGWGRLASAGGVAAPFGDRPPIVIGQGGNINSAQWFRGDMAPFGGLEWKLDDHWDFKAEYSPDAYDIETGRGTMDRNSPLNFAVGYQRSDKMRYSAYYMYGSEIGIAAQVIFNPGQRPAGGIGGSGPQPVKPRPSYAADPEFWSTDWVKDDAVQAVLINNLAVNVKRPGIFIEALGYDGRTAQVRFRNIGLDAEAQAVGRGARAMALVLPASIEVFEIIPVVNGIPASMVTVKRSDIEALEFAPDAAGAIRARTTIADAGRPIADLAFNQDLFPIFRWSLTPYAKLRFFNVDSPVAGDVGLRLAATYEVAPGFVLAGAVTKKLFGNIKISTGDDASALQPVRSDLDFYDVEGDPGLESLTGAWYSRLGPNLYGRVTAGYLEQMFGGISTEALWMPTKGRLALGVEANYVMQRDRDMGFGFGEYDYAVATGHVSGYYDFGKGYHARLDVGRYLAGDVGATMTLNRIFANGWKVGAYFTLTNVPAEDYGEGSFDKGINLEIPLSWFTGRPTRTTRPLTLRSVGRDGGARLEVQGRLYDSLRSYQGAGLDEQWGRFWK